MAKSPDAFRTISEVAEWLDRPAHVLRFWESKFPQVKPVKRAGGRRYYRPQDMLLLGGIKQLLHDDGLTIKGVQKILREQGVAHVSELSQPLDDISAAQLGEVLRAAEEDSKPTAFPAPPPPAPQDDASDEEAPMSVDMEPEGGTVLSFNRGAEPEPEAPMDLFSHGGADLTPDQDTADAPHEDPAGEDVADLPDFITDSAFDSEPDATEPQAAAPEPVAPDVTQATPETPAHPAAEAQPESPAPEPVAPVFTESATPEPEAEPALDPLPEDAHASEAPMPAEPTKPSVMSEAEPPTEQAETPEPAVAPAPVIAVPDLPDPPADDDIKAGPGLLTAIAHAVQHGAPPPDAGKVAPLLARLATLSSRMQDARKH